MPVSTMRRNLERMGMELGGYLPSRSNPVLEKFIDDPPSILKTAKIQPDPWQADLLNNPSRRILLNCSRQSGKSTLAAALALRIAMTEDDSLVLVLSPTQRQSQEFFQDKVKRLYQDLGRPLPLLSPRDSSSRMELTNGSRILSLPGDAQTVQGYSSVKCLIVDEAARSDDALYYSIRPMLAVSEGMFIGLSTPYGKRGWFHQEWIGKNPWTRIRITAEQCPRISRSFLAEEREALGEHWFRQEYFCSFEATVDSVFRYEDVMAAMKTEGNPWSLD